MSEEKTPAPTISEEENVKSSLDAAEDDAPELPLKSQETIMDVFKKFAGGGTNWADMMIEEESQKEEAERKIQLDKINKDIGNFKKPFIIYVKYNPSATAEDLYFCFGGSSGKVEEVYLYDKGKSGGALIELGQLSYLADALMKNEMEFFGEKLSIEYVDVPHHKCFTIPQAHQAEPPMPSQSVQPPRVQPQQNVNRGGGRDLTYGFFRSRGSTLNRELTVLSKSSLTDNCPSTISHCFNIESKPQENTVLSSSLTHKFQTHPE